MNRSVHQITAAAATAIVLHARERKFGQPTLLPVAGAGLAAFLTMLPDMLEPAYSPSHRQFFHSLAFAGVVATGWKKLYDWKPESDDGQIWRRIGMIAAAAYICHLALDATTPNSLPLLGR